MSDLIPLREALKKAATTLKRAEVPFALGGGYAAWALGAPEPGHDVDLMIAREDVDRAIEVLSANGFRTLRPPEDWLVKAYDGDSLVDLIFHPLGTEITHELIARCQERVVAAVIMKVLPVDLIVTTKLLAMTEHALDFDGLLVMSRALREQVDWDRVRAETKESPYARSFFVLLDELGVVTRG